VTNRSEIDALYADAVALADRARSWFDGPGLTWRQGLTPDDRARVAIETLAVTARLLAVVSWTLDRGAAKGRTAAPHGLDPAAPLPPVLAATPGGEISARSRMLAVRLSVLSAPARPLLSASYEAVWRV
jgi:Protein of unknown function (DUF1465)